MTSININLQQIASQVAIEGTDPVANNSFTGQIGNAENDSATFTGWNPDDWKYNDTLGGAQVYLAANPGGDNGGTPGANGFYVFTAGNNDVNNDGAIDGNGAGVGNAEIFSALDNDGSDLGAANGAKGAWMRSLRDNGVLTGLGVSGLKNGSEGTVSNLGVTNNTEIQSAAGIGAADQLLVDFGKDTTSAKFELGLFYSLERVNWSRNNDGSYNTLPGANSKDAEGMTYEMLKSVAPGTPGSKVVGGKTYLSVGTGVTSAYASGTGTYATGTPVAGQGNFNGNPGLSTATINTTNGATFNAIVFGGEDYFRGTPNDAGFTPNDVSDYLLNKVSVLDEGIVGGSGADTINGGDGNDTIAGGPGTFDCYDGDTPADWAAKGATISARILGTNTDVVGFMAPLKKLSRDWAKVTPVILGNGGAARAVVVGCLELGCKKVCIVGRHVEKLKQFQNSWTNLKAELKTYSWSDLPELLPTTELLVNTTPMGMYPKIEESPLDLLLLKKLPTSAIVYDLIYTPKPTQFLKLAAQSGAIAIDGLEMLVVQGAAALELWLNQPVPIDIMSQALLNYLS